MKIKILNLFLTASLERQRNVIYKNFITTQTSGHWSARPFFEFKSSVTVVVDLGRPGVFIIGNIITNSLLSPLPLLSIVSTCHEMEITSHLPHHS